jgi:DNA polymerase-3 subunit epsilon
LLLARKRFPGAQANLDALCRRFAIDLSARSKHSAKLDSELLAAVYLELIGGRQPGLDLAVATLGNGALDRIDRPARPPRPHAPTVEELAAHAVFLQKIKTPLWLAA